MKQINENLQIDFKKVAPDNFKLTQIIDGHKIEFILEKSQARQFIQTIDNEII